MNLQKKNRDTLIIFVGNMYNNLYTNHTTLGLLIEFRTAFDTVNHEILPNKLEKSGIRDVYYQKELNKLKYANHLIIPLKVKLGVREGRKFIYCIYERPID